MDSLADLQAKLTAYRPNDTVTHLLRQTPIVLLAAISGGGKDTVKDRLLTTGNYHHIVSNTTRPPRLENGVPEQDGVAYHFITMTLAKDMLDTGAFVEADLYANNIYGTDVDEVRAAHAEGRIGITDMTIEGTLKVLALAPTVKVVFLMPPSYEIWMERLLKRYEGKLQPHDLRLRMQEAVGEIQMAMASENMYLVVNDNIDHTVALVDDIAHGKPVEPHHPKSLAIARQLLARIQSELKPEKPGS